MAVETHTTTTSSINTDPKGKQRILVAKIEYPGESPDTDYKCSIAFNGKSDFSLNLTRHVLGMANAGGGFIVIGFDDHDGKLERDSNIPDEVISSYEVTKFCQMVNSKIADERVDLLIHKITFEDRVYPIIEVREFANQPFFCKSTCKDTKGNVILKQGALYIRTGETNTVEMANPKDWKRLVDVMVHKHNEGFLDEFRRLLESFQKSATLTNLQVSVSDGTQVGDKLEIRKESAQEVSQSDLTWFRKQRTFAIEGMKTNGFEPKYFEVTSQPIGYSRKLGDSARLLEVMQRSKMNNTGWPQGLVLYNNVNSPKPMEDGVFETIVGSRDWLSFDHWALSDLGLYYFMRNFYEDVEKREVPWLAFDTQIWRIAEAIDHTFNLYSNLGFKPADQICLMIVYSGLNGRHLTVTDPRRMMWGNRVAAADSSTWKVITSLDELKVNRRQLISEIVRKVSLLFDFFEPTQGVIDDIVGEFDRSRL